MCLVIILFMLFILVNVLIFVWVIFFRVKKWFVRFCVVVLLILWIFNEYKNLVNVVCLVFCSVLIKFLVDLGFICLSDLKWFCLRVNKLVGVLISLWLISWLIILLFSLLILSVLCDVKCLMVCLCCVW